MTGGGDLGGGSGTTYDVAQVTLVFSQDAVEITKLVEYASNPPDKAIENAAKREIKNAMVQFRSFLDKMMQTNGNGVLGTISTITTSGLPFGVAAQFNMAKPPGAQLTALFGILYHQTNATTGTWLNLNRATYPVERAAPNVNGNNSALSPGAVRLAINKVRKSLPCRWMATLRTRTAT